MKNLACYHACLPIVCLPNTGCRKLIVIGKEKSLKYLQFGLQEQELPMGFLEKPILFYRLWEKVLPKLEILTAFLKNF